MPEGIGYGRTVPAKGKKKESKGGFGAFIGGSKKKNTKKSNK